MARYTPLPVRINNFGDLIGPLVIRAVLQRLGLATATPNASARLFSVGSVLHFADTGDVVWGSGVNGKMAADLHRFATLDVRAVRGPLTREFLQRRDIDVPEVYGDPALLMPYLFPQLRKWSKAKKYSVTIVPNLNDLRNYPAHDARLLDPRVPLMDCLRRIAESEMVVGSSLHGIIVAEALGIPARVITPGVESSFKYLDYYQGTGRPGFDPAASVTDAIAAGSEPPLDFSLVPLVRAFPVDLWSQSKSVDPIAILGDALK